VKGVLGLTDNRFGECRQTKNFQIFNPLPEMTPSIQKKGYPLGHSLNFFGMGICDVLCDVTLPSKPVQVGANGCLLIHVAEDERELFCCAHATCAHSLSFPPSSLKELSRQRSRVRVPSSPPFPSMAYKRVIGIMAAIVLESAIDEGRA
jgi:hypothetical protein